jgi:RNA polymerase sigma-70 factor, ECF subfamily
MEARSCCQVALKRAALPVRGLTMKKDRKELVDRCLRGDAYAWTRLVEEHRGPVYGLCYQFCGSPEDAEDLMQEAFLKVYANLASYDADRGELKSWINALTRNHLVDHFRRSSQQRRTDSMDAGWDQSSEFALSRRIADKDPTPHDRAVTNEIHGIVRNAVGKIPPKMQVVVNLRFVEELDYQEIADRLRIPEGTVKSRINRGRAELARLLHPVRTALGVA